MNILKMTGSFKGGIGQRLNFFVELAQANPCVAWTWLLYSYSATSFAPISVHLLPLIRSHDVVLLAEVMDEASYVRHHKKKLAFVFSCMRHFGQELTDAGWQVDYVKLDDDGNAGSLKAEVERAIKRHDARSTSGMTEAGEWRLKDDVASWADDLGVEVEVLEDDRFICSHDRFRRWASGRKSLRMEYFYREMRRDTGLLVNDDGEPEGGQWNYDHDNRKPADQDMFMPKPLLFEPDDVTREVMELVADRFDGNFGDLEPFCFAVTRADAEAALDHFIRRGAGLLRRLSGRHAGRRGLPVSLGLVALHQYRAAEPAGGLQAGGEGL
jgi:deoxyribodipyrimidine photolyase-like uncharacterized protein